VNGYKGSRMISNCQHSNNYSSEYQVTHSALITKTPGHVHFDSHKFIFRVPTKEYISAISGLQEPVRLVHTAFYISFED
jgi:hypothetical protein